MVADLAGAVYVEAEDALDTRDLGPRRAGGAAAGAAGGEVVEVVEVAEEAGEEEEVGAVGAVGVVASRLTRLVTVVDSFVAAATGWYGCECASEGSGCV